MYVLFKNSNENNELYYGEVITSIEKINSNPLYIDAIDCISLKEQKPDWKQSYINPILFEDIVAFSPDVKSIALKFPRYFL